MKYYKEDGRHHRAKLTDEQVIKIRKLHAKNPKLWHPNRLAEFFGVSGGTIRPILEGRTWKDVKTNPALGVEYWSHGKVSAAGIAKIIELHRNGKRNCDISRAMHIPHPTVSRQIKKWNAGRYVIIDGRAVCA